MLRDELIAIYREAVAAFSGERLVREALAGEPMPPNVLALGKAAASMVRGLPAAPRRLLVVTTEAAHDAAKSPGGIAHRSAGDSAESRTEKATAHDAAAAPTREWLVGDHPHPGARSFAAGARLLQWMRALPPDEPLLVLLSGGASALLEAPAPGLAPEDLTRTTRALLAGGAPIEAINAVRKHLSRIKGGRLADGRPTTVLSISDVPGDDPAVIGSGPFSPDPTTFADALEALRTHAPDAPTAVFAHLRRAEDETPKAEAPNLAYRILAGPLDLPREAVRLAKARGFPHAEAFPTQLEGDVREIAARHAEFFTNAKGPRLLACPAEPTLHLPPNPGRGGRSQHLALLVARAIHGIENAAFLAAGSDGRDGLSDNAGAAVDGSSYRPAYDDLLERAASAEATEITLPAWDTGTNLADLHLLALAKFSDD